MDPQAGSAVSPQARLQYRSLNVLLVTSLAAFVNQRSILAAAAATAAVIRRRPPPARLMTSATSSSSGRRKLQSARVAHAPPAAMIPVIAFNARAFLEGDRNSRGPADLRQGHSPSHSVQHWFFRVAPQPDVFTALIPDPPNAAVFRPAQPTLGGTCQRHSGATDTLAAGLLFPWRFSTV